MNLQSSLTSYQDGLCKLGAVIVVTLLACAGGNSQDSPASLGIFEGQNDVGTVLHPGSAEYNSQTKAYVVSGSGENMWFGTDEFHFVWKKVSAEDITLTADINILGSGGDGHRKGLLMIRQSLDQDSAYADTARHGDGLTSLQFRERKGAVTREVESAVSGPSKLRIEKQGDRFYMWIAGENESLQFAGGSAKVELHAPFYVGIGVCAHNKDAVQKVEFTNVELETTVSHPKVDYSTIETVIQAGDARTGYVSRDRLTAPGWSADGHALTYEIDGKRQEAPFRPLKTALPVGAPLPVLGDKYVYSASKQSGSMQIWRKLRDGGEPEQLTSDDFNNVSPHLSPDGKFLLFLSYPKDLDALPENQDIELRMMSLADRSVKELATFVGGQGSLGTQPWSPDGRRAVFISYQSMK
jgi:TolB protein